MDKSVKPGTDFYQYAVGNWVKNNPVPDDQSAWTTFNVIREKTSKDVKGIIQEAANAKNQKLGTVGYKIGMFYNVGMDSAKIEEQGIKPIEKELKRIDLISNETDIAKEVAHMQMHTAIPLFFFYSTPDSKQSDFVIAGMWQGGLGLPDRDYYLNKDDKFVEIRTAYSKHIETMFKLIGETEEVAKNNSNIVIDFETRLAKASNTMNENRDPNATYNKMTTNEIIAKAPGFDWATYFEEIKAGDPGVVDVAQPKFIKEIGKMATNLSVENWKVYLKWNLINFSAEFLNNDLLQADFAFYGKTLSGAQTIRPRWKRVVAATNGALGEAVGQLYVKKFFPAEAKERARKIVSSLLESMGESIKNNTWMSDETKEKALIKLGKFGVKIGYPDKWVDYTSLEINDDSFIENMMRANYFLHNEMIAELNKPIKKWKWAMTPQTVNAYYSPNNNEIAFPAAILQYPFYDYQVDDAINYGAMGAIIGHEITHGFDDQGRLYDEDGNIKEWWTKEDSEKFNKKAQGIIGQFNEYVVIDTFKIDGSMTQGENIADLGGLTVSYNAFMKTKQFNENKKIDEFTPSQRFFLGWAQAWKNNMRDEELINRVKTDVHSPGKFRVNGPLTNLKPFFEAFDIKSGEPMRRDEDKIVKIW